MSCEIMFAFLHTAALDKIQHNSCWYACGQNKNIENSHSSVFILY